MQKRRVHADRQVALGPGAYGNKGSWPLRHRLLAIDNCIDRGVQGGTPEASTFVWCSARRRHQQAPRSAPSPSSYILLLPCPATQPIHLTKTLPSSLSHALCQR